MKQITEDYCSFEVAKLLKEKGFDELCNYEWWIPNNDKGYVLIANGQIKNSNLIDEAYTAPTHQMTLKWLREVHDIHINFDIHWLHFANQKGWMYIVEKILDNGIEYIDSKGDENDATFFSTYEKVCEAALNYVLKNLI